MQVIVLYETNQQAFIDTINKAKEVYSASVGIGKEELISDGNWNVPLTHDYPANYVVLPLKLAVAAPYYQGPEVSQVEKDFIKYLESKDVEIEWWYKNGENDTQHFAVPYDDKGTPKSFYIDWIVKYKDGKIGLFDTKSGITADIAKSKAEGLFQYIKQQNSLGKTLFGGIVIPHNGSWRLNDKEIYEYNKHNLKDWGYLS